jgi:hypothetical protein
VFGVELKLATDIASGKYFGASGISWSKLILKSAGSASPRLMRQTLTIASAAPVMNMLCEKRVAMQLIDDVCASTLTTCVQLTGSDPVLRHIRIVLSTDALMSSDSSVHAGRMNRTALTESVCPFSRAKTPM